MKPTFFLEMFRCTTSDMFHVNSVTILTDSFITEVVDSTVEKLDRGRDKVADAVRTEVHQLILHSWRQNINID